MRTVSGVELQYQVPSLTAAGIKYLNDKKVLVWLPFANTEEEGLRFTPGTIQVFWPHFRHLYIQRLYAETFAGCD